MSEFANLLLPVDAVGTAPDGTDVRPLLQLDGGSLAHFTLAPGVTSIAVTHRTVEELWYFLSGSGQVWRKQNGLEEVVEVSAGVSLTIPLGTSFQFRSQGDEPLVFIAVTMPPWPGPDEALATTGLWEATVSG